MSGKNVSIFWLGQMGLMVKAGDTTICIDYFASPHKGRQTEAPLSDEELTGVSAFLGTHDHLDHIDHEAWKKWAKVNPKAKFIFSKAHMAGVLADGIAPENAIGVNEGESVQIGDVKISAIAAAHEFLDYDEATGVYPHLCFIIEACGVRILHAGDTVRYEGMLPKLQAFGEFDVALLPINGRDADKLRRDCIGNMTFQEAADLAGELSVKLAIPGHWDMFADNSEDPNKFVDYLTVKYKGKVSGRVPKLMEEITVVK